MNSVAQLQVAPGTHWVCNEATHTYTVLHNIGFQYNGPQQLLGSVFKFTGAAPVPVDGGANIMFNIIEVAKDGIGTVRLLHSINVYNKISFQSGMIDLNGNVLDLRDDAFIEGENATARCIGSAGGYVQVVTVLKAPVNSNPGNLGAVIISSDPLGETTIRRGHASQQNTNGGGSSVLRYYDILPQQNTRLSASLQFNYFDEELNGINEGRMVLVKKETAADPWEIVGADERNTTNNYIIKRGISSFSRWTLSGTDNALPVIWRSFTVTCSGNTVGISWTTETEINTKEFSVQCSTDGVSNWESINIQPASGNSTAPKTYYYTNDISASPGNLYYRVMQTDADGRFSYSPVVHAVCSSVEEVVVYPNPVTDMIWVAVNNIQHSKKVSLALRNAVGAVVLKKQLSLQPGRSVLQLPVTALPAGMYTLSVELNNLLKTFKVVKQ
ncbi:MAG: T9SS type A sorting domain-containing protein [Agriterribacter sp.]